MIQDIPFGEVGPPWWDDRPVFLVGGGPSLRGFDFNRLRGAGHVLGVNQAMFDAPAAAGISIDIRFIKERRAQLATFARTAELYLVFNDFWWRGVAEPLPGAIYIRDEQRGGLSRQQNFIRRNLTSGYAALNLATLKAARRIVLLGYDYGSLDDRHHYHEAYPWHVHGEQSWADWALRFKAAAADCRSLGVEIVNASQTSKIECFPKMTIEDALRWAGL